MTYKFKPHLKPHLPEAPAVKAYPALPITFQIIKTKQLNRDGKPPVILSTQYR